jgi:aspartyl-tRNA(Asn)/glutamyl-tRNA(Gln) amidotransferase subunit A
VALGIVPFALGTDTGGSIRQPAAQNEILGVKPTYGAVSRYGVVAMSSSMDSIGCMANDPETADLVMGIMAGKDTADATSLPDFWQNEPENKKLRVGALAGFTDDAIEKLKQVGHEVSEIEMPTLKYGKVIYDIVQSAEVASTMMRYDGVRFGYRAEDVKDLDDLYTRSRDEGLGIENKRRIMFGNFVVSTGNYEKYYLKAQKARTLLISEYDKVFENFDVLLCPTTDDAVTSSVNLAGLPAVSLPSGAQLIGPRCSDRALLKLAKEIL